MEPSTTVDAQVDLSVTKTASNLTPNELDPVVYTVTVTNNGPHDATGVVVQDILDPGLTYPSHVVSQGTYSTTTGLWTVGAIARTTSTTLQITVQPRIGTGGTNVPNAAAVSGVDQADTDLANNSASISITPVAVPFPNIVIAKSVQIVSDPFNFGTDPKAIPGATMLYDIIVTNQGIGTAANVTVADGLPANTSLRVADIGIPGSGPVAFINGAIVSGLSYTFSGLGNGTDNLEFSNDNGATWTYTPVPDGNGVDAAVTNIRVPLTGTFNAAAGANQPSFRLRFQVVVR